MPTTTTHAPGTFCWPELAAKDIRAAIAFYQPLFDWSVHETPMGEGESYFIFLQGQHSVAAGYQLNDAMMPGVPPHWAAYVSVADADASAERAKALGGEVVMGPFDVANSGRDLGRMAVMKDPTGAVFCVWQAKEHCGVEKFGEAGTLAWTQLNTQDTGAAKGFYTQLFGWTAQDDPNPMGGTYTTWMKADGPAGGMMGMPAGSPAPAHWLTYFGVESVDATLAKATAGGAQVFVPAVDIPGMGRFAVLADPQGAFFALVTFSA
jgi:hypothetical protein